MPDAIIPGDAVAALVAAAKLAPADTLPVESDGKRLTFTMGELTITTKLIDGTFPDWSRPFHDALAPTGGAEALFPELLPGARPAMLEKLAKPFKGELTWQAAQNGMLGSVAGDDGLLFGVIADHSGQPAKGFYFGTTGEIEARAYLESLAQSRGHPGRDHFEALCEPINTARENRTLDDVNSDRHGEYATAFVDLISEGAKVLGLTIGGKVAPNLWASYGAEPIEGSYSIVMPDDGPQISYTAPHHVDAADGNRYLIADNGSKLHLSASQVRALIDESCFETMEVARADGRAVHILKWLWEDGANRFLTVRPDGRCYDGGEYVGREEIEAVMRGEYTSNEVEEIVEPASPPRIDAQSENEAGMGQPTSDAPEALCGLEIEPTVGKHRTPAHMRAIRAYLDLRKARRKFQAYRIDAKREYATLEARLAYHMEMDAKTLTRTLSERDAALSQLAQLRQDRRKAMLRGSSAPLALVA